MNFLHLSDIHFQRDHSGGTYDLDKDLRNELERDVKRTQEKYELKVDGILVTGDIAFAGQKEEFEIASEWLGKLCDLLHCDPAESVWVVPGNHDVDRRTISDSALIRTCHEKLRRAGNIDDEIAQYMKDPGARQLLYQPLEQYNLFAGRFECVIDSTRPCWEDDLRLNDGSTIRLLGLNTTLVSSSLDDQATNKLILGTIQVSPHNLEGVTYLSMGHHPPQWLLDEDNVNDWLKARVRVQLFGHKHRQSVEFINDCVRITAGAVHPDRKEHAWSPRYNYIGLMVSGVNAKRNLEVTIYPRIWSDRDKEFKPDRDGNDQDFQRRNLPLPAWVPVVPQNIATSTNTTINNENIIGTTDKSVATMNRSRRLAYRFYTLPYDIRISVLNELKLIRSEDEGFEGHQFFYRVLSRAKKEDLLAQLWDKVQEAHGDGEYRENPYRD